MFLYFRGYSFEPERFWSKVQVGGWVECWLWKASVDRYGYGKFKIGPYTALAHKVIYEALVGQVPEGEVLDHVLIRGCGPRACVNPFHLEPVSHTENVRRGRSCGKSWDLRYEQQYKEYLEETEGRYEAYA